eukprot:2298121-Rhodomonas_salina.1
MVFKAYVSDISKVISAAPPVVDRPLALYRGIRRSIKGVPLDASESVPVVLSLTLNAETAVKYAGVGGTVYKIYFPVGAR